MPAQRTNKPTDKIRLAFSLLRQARSAWTIPIVHGVRVEVVTKDLIPRPSGAGESESSSTKWVQGLPCAVNTLYCGSFCPRTRVLQYNRYDGQGTMVRE